MFLIDKVFRKHVNKGNHIDKAIRELKVKEDINKEKYLYVVEKLSISILMLFITMCIGLLVYINEQNQNIPIKKVERNTNQNLVVKKEDGETTQIVLDVPRRQLSKKEKEDALDKAEKVLPSKIIGENESLNKVNHKLNLVNNIGEENIAISWIIEDSSIVDYEGNIGNSIPKEGKLVKIEATLMLEDEIREVMFFINVFPNEDKESINDYLQNYVEENDVSKEKVVLPETIGENTVQYYKPEEKISGIIIIGGIFIAFAVFILKDKDLVKEVKERNKQLKKDYPEVVSKILLFYGAGLSIKMTFEEIVKEYEKEKARDKSLFRYAYEEMIITTNKMRTGVPERVAIGEYGKRCGLHCYIKLSNIIEQNLKRGTREITYALREELNNAANERKNSGLKEGNEISTKLLGPMVVMLIIAIVIVIVPAFMSMNF